MIDKPGPEDHKEDAKGQSVDPYVSGMDGGQKAYQRAQKAYEATKRLGKRLSETAGRLTTSEWITAIFTVIIAAATIWNVVVVRNSLGILQGQLDEMKAARESGDRPWLQSVGLKVKSFRSDGKYVAIWTNLSLKNVGHSPALKVHITTALMPSLSTSEEASEVIRLCRKAKANSYNFYSSIMFPGEDRTYIPNETLFSLDVFTGLPPFADLTLLGCVTYQSINGDEVHATSFGLDLSRRCIESAVGKCAFEFSGPVSLAASDMIESPVLEAYAD